jgi:hypothetical protein
MTGSRHTATTKRKATRMEPATLQPRLRELAHRESSDVDVTLFWRQEDDSVLLLLVEVPTGVVFEVPVRPEDAMTAFNHPYAYLPARRVPDTVEELLAA